jgi:hypothetical protein
MKPPVWQGKLKALKEFGEAQTRRLDGLKEINKAPDDWMASEWHLDTNGNRQYRFDSADKYLIIKPRYHVGEILYVKESWRIINWSDERCEFDVEFKDGKRLNSFCISDIAIKRYWRPNQRQEELEIWRSPMFLPAEFARYFIHVTDLKAQRLNNITEEDALLEGITVMAGTHQKIDYKNIKLVGKPEPFTAKYQYLALWDSINPSYPSSTNPHEFTYTFKQVEKPEVQP